MDAKTVLNRIKYRKPTLFNEDKIKKYAILLPLIEKDGETHLLFEVRSMNLNSQPGDVCFPGGKVDPTDESEKHAALRETIEELGVTSEDIFDVFPLDYMMPSPDRMIYPFIGRIEEKATIIPNKAEVDEVFTIPLRYFLETDPEKYDVFIEAVPADDFPLHLIVGGEDYNWQHRKVTQYFYTYNNYVIWGLTAKIIVNFLDVLRNNK